MSLMVRTSRLILATVFLIHGCGGNEEPQAPFTPMDITLRESGELKELVDDKLVFVDESGTEWVAPKGTLTDGASIPRIALPVTDGRWDREFLKAAVVHDAYCQSENETRTPRQYRTRTWQAVHRMFYEACVAGGTKPLLAKIMFAAVWLAGPRWDDPESEIGQISSEMVTRGFIGTKNWIEENDPSIDAIVADLNQREPLLVNLSNLEADIENAVRVGDARRASALLRQQEVVLSEELAREPDDLMLLSFKGGLHKNQAILHRRMNNTDAATRELSRSEQAFQSVVDKEPRDPGALTGLSKVSILQGDYDRGVEYAREALRIAPNYNEAKKDLEENIRLRERPPLELETEETE